MSNKSKLLIIGHSHVGCLRSAIQARPDIKDILVININNKTTEVLKKQIESFEPDAVCVCLRGNQHNVLGILENPVPFSVGEKFKGSTSPSSEERVFIPLALMEEYFDSKLQKLLLHSIYKSAPDAIRMYLNPPPPISDFSHIQKYPGPFLDKLELGPAPNELKMQLYKIQSNVLRNLSDKENATFIDVEPVLLDPEGFLDSKYFDEDPTHGNAAYGKVMLEKIIKISENAR